MLFVRHDADGCVPVVRCHVCNKTICNLSTALVVYPQAEEVDLTYRVAIAHVGSCGELLERTLANDLGPARTLPLDEYLDRLEERRRVDC